VNSFSKSLMIAPLGLAIALSSALAQTGAPTEPKPSTDSSKASAAGVSKADATFIKKAASGGMAEVDLGRLATEKASNPDVKQFGQRMVDDHSKANDQLKQVAAEKHVTLPTSISAKDKATKAKLEALSGDQFDRAYMEDMVKDHKQDVAEFQKASKSASDPQIKDWASQTLPTLQDHLKEAQRIAPTQKAEARPTK
jgi:putative membrane protein